MLVQEPPTFEGVRHPGFDFLRTRGRLVDGEEGGYGLDGHHGGQLHRRGGGRHPGPGYGRQKPPGRVVRVVNAYFQRQGRSGTYRPTKRTLWDDILGGGDCSPAGDFNAHSPV